MEQSEKAISGLLKAAFDVPKETVIKLLGDPQRVKLGEAVQLAHQMRLPDEGPTEYRGRIEGKDEGSGAAGS